MQPETKFKLKIWPKLRAIPGSWFVKIAQKSIKGTPDFLGIIRGRMIALELKKSDKERPSKLQRLNIEKITRAGGYATVVNPENWDKVYEDLCGISSGD